ncbi:MAG: cysteine desulfurase family protein [Candidatus Hatepunaea meridiana]|nr:cysteine desulfurase family protein [Candidatus Hatepunaea meridiana]
MKRIYFDHSATTPVDPRVAEVIREMFLEKFGNPSSLHSFGTEAKDALEEARAKVATILHCSPAEVYFTSGGTEADNIALRGYSLQHRDSGNHIIVGSIEHPAVRNSATELEDLGFNVTLVAADKYGEIHPEAVADSITDDTILVSVMHVNNEVGTINDIGSIGSLCRERGITYHTDAVQSYGKVPLDVQAMSIDMASVSSHKIYGPKGVGALYLREGIKVHPLFYGGHQENGVRIGTENLPGIVGLGKAAEICTVEMNDEAIRLSGLRDALYQRLTDELDDIYLNGHHTRRLPGNLNLTISNIEGEALLMALDLAGIAVSSGSACSSGSKDPSPILLGIGLSPEEAHSTMRITLGRENTEDDIEYAADVIISTVKRLRAMAG